MSLTKAEQHTRDTLLDDLRGAKDELEDAISVYYDEMELALNKLNGKVSNYNGVLEQVQNFRDAVVNRLQEAIDSKSEKWLEGERGEATVALKDEWEGLSLDPLDDFESQDDFRNDMDVSHADEMEALSTEVEV